jgi:hypothetical protein
MREVILIVFALFNFSCVQDSAADKTEVVLSTPPIANKLSDDNVNKLSQIESAKSDVNEEKRNEIKEQNAKFKIVPDEWKQIDFENFTYPTSRMKGFIHLKNGKFEYSNRKEYDEHFGSGGNGYYVDLVGDSVKEVIIFITDVSCGGSCDGGRELIYFYSIQNKKPILLGRIETGSRAYGCSIKSFKVKNKEITIEQFGRCQKKSDENENKNYICKFCVKDLTVSKYILDGKKPKRTSSEIISTPELDVKNYTDTVYSIE